MSDYLIEIFRDEKLVEKIKRRLLPIQILSLRLSERYSEQLYREGKYVCNIKY
ncbi:MAG: hypothetical protein PWP57_120 [Candidatus Atribacteria bacterium]|nr:hypothetical protein [Candidatus Atribacteria bacterium]